MLSVHISIAYPAILIICPDSASLFHTTSRRGWNTPATWCRGCRCNCQGLYTVRHGRDRVVVVLRSSKTARKLCRIDRRNVVVGCQELDVFQGLREDMVKQSSSLRIGWTRHGRYGESRAMGGVHPSLVVTTASERLPRRRHFPARDSSRARGASALTTGALRVEARFIPNRTPRWLQSS